METLPTAAAAPPGVALYSEQAQPAQLSSVPPGTRGSSTEAQKAKWRAKYHARRAKALGATHALPLAPVSPAPSAVDSPLAPGGSPPVVPWDSGTLKPLFEELVPALEKADVASLKKRAEKISPDLVLLVETDGKWSEPAKTSILSAAPQVAAKWLNASGISAENQGEVVLAIAAISILTSRSLLIGKLDQMAAKNTVKLPVAPEAKP